MGDIRSWPDIHPLPLLGTMILVAVVALLGWFAGDVLRPAPEAPPAAPASRDVRVGPLSLSVPPSWRDSSAVKGSAAAAAGATVFNAVPEPGTMRWIANGPIDSASLIPARVRDVLTQPPSGRTPVRLAGRPAWAYEDLRVETGGRLALIVAPVKDGVLMIGCEVPYGPPPGDCGDGVRVLDGPAALAPAADLALRLRAPVALTRLRQAREQQGLALRRARTAREQSAAARRLAAAHARAAATLRPVAAGTRSGPRLLRALGDVRLAYDNLARAAGRAWQRSGSPRAARRAYERARGRVTAAQKGLARALEPLAAARPAAAGGSGPSKDVRSPVELSRVPMSRAHSPWAGAAGLGAAPRAWW